MIKYNVEIEFTHQVDKEILLKEIMKGLEPHFWNYKPKVKVGSIEGIVMDKKILKNIEFINGNIIQKNIFLSIIETRNRDESEYLREIELNTGTTVISNSEKLSEFNKNSLIVDNKEFLNEFFKSILPSITISENPILVLLDIEDMYLCKRSTRIEASEFFKFIEHRRNHNVSIIMFARKYENFPKFIRENSDITIRNYQN